MSTDTSVPGPRAARSGPRVAGLGVSDSALLDTLLREAPIGFAFFDASLRFRRVNATLARLHGLSPEDLLGRQPSDVWPAALATRSQDARRRVLADGQPVLESDQPVVATAALLGNAEPGSSEPGSTEPGSTEPGSARSPDAAPGRPNDSPEGAFGR